MKKDGNCKNKYPKAFVLNTITRKKSYPIYKRWNDGATIVVKNCTMDNWWVVHDNPYLFAKFDFHLNIEIRSTIKEIKYLYKYFYKRHDVIAMNISSINDVDE